MVIRHQSHSCLLPLLYSRSALIFDDAGDAGDKISSEKGKLEQNGYSFQIKRKNIAPISPFPNFQPHWVVDKQTANPNLQTASPCGGHYLDEVAWHYGQTYIQTKSRSSSGDRAFIEVARERNERRSSDRRRGCGNYTRVFQVVDGSGQINIFNISWKNML